MMFSIRRPRSAVLWLAAALALPALALLALVQGAGSTSVGDSLAFLFGAPAARADLHLHNVIVSLRLPRMLAALLVGSALGVAGALMQAVTRNPLAEPGLLGVNAGAALGVVVGIGWFGAESGPGYLVWAGLGALLGNVCVLGASHIGHGRTDAPLRLVLAGAALGATFHGLASAILLSQPTGYDQYRFWVLGSLSGITSMMTGWTAIPVITGLIFTALLARPLSALLLGDEVASALGHRPRLLRLMAALTVTLLTGSAVALAGPVAFLGLMAPFLARGLVGSSLPAQLALSAWLGASLLLLADLAARYVAQPFETPISVLTALLGAPLLVWVARSQRDGSDA
ncbi:FecCD family ABC transporter permease [Chitinimonas lacunae]|uniref:FecCD family ABC transporter permease n=1 Tax=Chitinimonas lacunae TaxID=1963018 RepID=A0ABV8MN28_9NEIS